MDERMAIHLAAELLHGLLGASAYEVTQEKVPVGASGRLRPAPMISAGSYRFVIQYKPGARADQVGTGLRLLRQFGILPPDVVPLLVVPFMGDVGERLCQEQGVSWLDLSGNAFITAPGLHVRVEGKPNRYKSRGRSPNLFAPASSRIARAVLLSPDRWFTQAELAAEVSLAPGSVSRLMPRYEDSGFIERKPDDGRILLKAQNPDLLLDAWRDSYDFSIHEVHRGHIPARSGTELLKRLAAGLDQAGVEYAATGLSSAWLLEPFASFRLVTVYLSQWPPREVLDGLMFREEAKGANVWLVLPRDEGVYHGANATDGVRHVSAVQTYLDLKAQPERSEEAAEELRRTHLKWGSPDGR